MKEARLVKRTEYALSPRLIALVDAIPELSVNRGDIECGGFLKYTIYNADTGHIDYDINNNEIWLNPLKNKEKLKTQIKCGVRCVTEESFCDLLEEHIRMAAGEAK